MRFGRAPSWRFAVLLAATLASRAAAQNAVTVSGHVTAGSLPVRGANVGIPSLGLSATSDADGRYSFIVPSSRVRGQRVTLTARYLRYPPRSVEITLVGGALTQDFEMQTAPEHALPTERRPISSASDAETLLRPLFGVQRVVDSSALSEVPGALDLGSALAGRVTGLQVTSAVANGTSVLRFRGPHSIAAPADPLFVVDGVAVDNSSLNSRSEQFGAGGFDYGTAIRDLDLGDIASVTVLDQAQANILYGSRAANGVVVVTTKSGSGLNGFDVAASQQVSFESPLRLPRYQNDFGQGLNGQFEFFDGTGGGINDAIAESWGPPLDGRAVAQASYTQPGRPDVRLWLPNPNNVSGFFENGHTFTTNVSAQGGDALGGFRLAASDRAASGLTPSTSAGRETIALKANRRLDDRFSIAASGQFINNRESALPEAGFSPGNPMAEFAVMGRQVDLDALQSHVVDASGNQINWIYTTHDNPYFESTQNSNEHRRSRVLGGLSGTYSFAAALSATARVGVDSYHETRDFTVAPSWTGGFPYFAGQGDFSTGGFQNQGIAAHEMNLELFLQGGPTGANAFPLHVTGGASRRSNGLRLTTDGADFLESAGTNAALPPPERLLSDSHTDAIFVTADLGLGAYAALRGGIRDERISAASVSGVSTIYPQVSGTFDVGRALRLGWGGLESARLHASWSRAGNQLTAATLRSVYFGLDSTGFPAALPSASQQNALPPEISAAWDLGGGVTKSDGRLAFDVTYYHASSSDLVLPDAAPSRDAFSSSGRTGALTDDGIEAQLHATPILTRSGFEWSVVARYGQNRSRVDALSDAESALPLGPSLWGLTVEARTGEPLPTLFGSGYLRDPSTGQLLLEDGHPLPDSLNPRVLGSAEPTWTGSFANLLRFRGLELNLLIDAHVGGQVFSATNLWGQTSGTFIQTAFRPDTGLLIRGIDVATGQRNVRHVATQDYYHALLPIQEAWVYDATFAKLREARLTLDMPLHWLGVFTAQSLRASVIGRNLLMFARAPNIDPETALSASAFQGVELGQPPTAKSIGFQFSIVP